MVKMNNELDELFETQEILQNKGKNAIYCLKHLVEQEKLDSSFYPKLNEFMREFIDEHKLGKKLSLIKQPALLTYINDTFYLDDELLLDNYALNIKNVLSPHVKLTFSNEMQIQPADRILLDKYVEKILAILYEPNKLYKKVISFTTRTLDHNHWAKCFDIYLIDKSCRSPAKINHTGRNLVHCKIDSFNVFSILIKSYEKIEKSSP
jgi:hypothetical protein